MNISIIEPVGGKGGMDYYDYGLAYGLGENDCCVEYHTCAETQKRFFNNVHTHFTFSNVWKFSPIKKIFSFFYYYYLALRSSQSKSCEINHFHFFSLNYLNLLVLLMASFFESKTVVTLHDIESFHGKDNHWIESLCLRLIDAIVVHNQSSFIDLCNKDLSLPNVKIIPHGNYLPFVNSLPLPPCNPNINLLFFGQIKEVKGLDILLEAFSLVTKKRQNFRLTIAGRPWKSDLEKHKKLIVDLDLVDYVKTYFEYIPDEKVQDLYSESHVVVLPYRRIYQSGVLLLTMSYGRPVIASALPAFKEIILDGENSLMFKSENVEDLAERILSLSEGLISKMTDSLNASIYDKYDWVNIGRTTKSFYKEICS